MKGHDSDEDAFVREVRKQAERAQKGRSLSFWQGLGMVGSIGWMVSLPAVLGALLGRWLDGHAGNGIFWTLFLLIAGLVLGCASAWRHAGKEIQE